MISNQKEHKKGPFMLTILIMEKCPDLLPDYFSFVKGMVDSEDLSLNISREMLQHSRQLKLIAKNIKNKVKSELLSLLKDDRDKYERFYASFGRQLKFGIYSEYGLNRDELQELLMFYSSSERKMTTLDEYVSRMKEDQKYIYYASGESNEKIDRLPQIELVADKGYEILYLTEEVDEFAIRVLMNFKEKEFKSVSDSDLGLEADEGKRRRSEKRQALVMLMAMKDSRKRLPMSVFQRLPNPILSAFQRRCKYRNGKVLHPMPVEMT